MKKSWFVVLMLFLAGVISYLDRSALSIAAPLITKELGLQPAQLGIVFSAFFVGYAAFCFVGGYASDRFGAKRVLGGAMTLWSVFCGLTAAVSGIGSLLVVRAIFGIGEGPYAACTNKMVSGWFTPDKRTTAVGIANAGQQFGGAIAGPIVGFLALRFGWRVSFIAIGVLGVAWVLVWAFTVKDKPDANAAHGDAATGGRLADDMRAPVDGSAAAVAKPLRAYLTDLQILATSFAFFGSAYILYFFLSWFPSYLTMERHLSLASMSVVNVIPWAMGAVGLAIGGGVSDLLFRITGNALLAKKLVIVVSLVVAAACIAVAGVAASIVTAVLLLAVTVFFMSMTVGVYWGVIMDVVEPARVGAVGGFMHLIANAAGIVAPALTGFLVQWTGLFQSAFVVSGGVALLGALGVVCFVRAKPPAGTARGGQPVPLQG